MDLDGETDNPCQEGYSLNQTASDGLVCCENGCKECNKNSECLICKSNRFMSNNNDCVFCSQECLTCENLANHCTSCDPNDESGWTILSNNTCIKDCPNGTYKNQTTNACEPCHDHCATCSSSAEETNCLTCKFGWHLWEGVCQDCTDENNPYFTMTNGACVDKCGNGIRFSLINCPGLSSYNQCDDGNLVNGDGCDDQCKVEIGFKCIFTDLSTPDNCIPRTKPSAY